MTSTGAPVELAIRGKGSVSERLPLPTTPAGRGPVSSRGPAARVRPGGVPTCTRPQRGISAARVRSVVHHACDRAGLARVGAHRLRHTVASDLLCASAPLQQIAQVLRHASLASTAIYAKIDRSSRGRGATVAAREVSRSTLRKAAEDYLQMRRRSAQAGMPGAAAVCVRRPSRAGAGRHGHDRAGGRVGERAGRC